MSKSICTYGFIPVRELPSETSQMVTQLLFGETFTILERNEKWARITCDFDDYEGWIDAKLITSLPDEEVSSWLHGDSHIVTAPQIKVISEPDKHSRIISGGSRIVLNGSDMNSFVIANKEFYLSGNPFNNKKFSNVQELAINFLYTPYLWGGRSFFGIDCSGFVQIVYKMMGIRLPRDASRQVEHGETVSFVEEAVPGDLAFFDNPDGKIVHVGICMGKGEIIHASGEVRIDRLDHQGIFNQNLKKYSHKLRTIKRIVAKDELHV
jgi:hypothetical protein